MVGDATEEGEGADSSSPVDASPSPTPSAESGATGNNSGVLGQFCAESFAVVPQVRPPRHRLQLLLNHQIQIRRVNLAQRLRRMRRSVVSHRDTIPQSVFVRRGCIGTTYFFSSRLHYVGDYTR
jgi:hypothetical protein